MILYFIPLFILNVFVVCQEPSPCPEIFSYVPQKETDRWFGNITLTSEQNLTRVWLHITLDTPADILGNWFGPVETNDNTIFVIRRYDYLLKAGVTRSVPLFVKFNPDLKTIPSLKVIKLNGKTICPNPPKNSTSQPNTTTSRVKEKTITTTIPTTSKLTTAYRPSTTAKSILGLSEKYSGEDIRKETNSQILPKRTLTGATLDLTQRPTCGISAPKTSKGLNNDNTWPGRWPWNVAVYHTQNIDITYVCSATLITDEYMIAPARCVADSQTGKAQKPNLFSVILGQDNFNIYGANVQERSISNIIVHQQYIPWEYENNIAILKMSTPVKITDYVRPCCLWEGDSNLEKIVGKNGIIIGYNTSGILRQIDASVVAPWECSFSEFVDEKTYCVFSQRGNEIHSLGGMVFPREKVGQNNVWQIRGIINMPLQYGHISLTDVAKYVSWIKNIILK